MNIVIVGAGEIGLHMAELFCASGYVVTVIDNDPAAVAHASDKLDARVIEGKGESVMTLEEAAIAECNVFFALTSSDTANLVTASLAKALGAAKAIVRVHAEVQREQWLFDFRTRFDADHLFSPARLAAVELAKFIRNPDCLLVEEIALGRIELQQTVIARGSPAEGRSLRELNLPPRVRIGLIQRASSTVVPGGSEVLHEGDVLTIFGASRALDALPPVLRARSSQTDEVRVVIFGGGGYGFALAQILEGAGRFRTRIFETSAKRCAYLAGMLQRTTLINADATSVRLLREEQVAEADFFVAATGDDEDNLMSCLQAKDLGVKHCLTLVHRADYVDAITRVRDRVGILGAVSPRIATGRELMRFATTETQHTLVELTGGAEVIEFVVRPQSRLAGRRLGELAWPSGARVLSITRGASASVPAAEDEFALGDVVAVLVTREDRKALVKFIG
jgi:trk system potassium uptake protein TrkA